MRRSIFVVLLLLLGLSGCVEKDAFTSKRLAFEGLLRLESGAVVVAGTINLPDGFMLFVQVDEAPAYGVEATWAGQTRVTGGTLFFETPFTHKLPYRAKVLVTPALNPEYQESLAGPDLPFAVDSGWETANLADGGIQLSRTIEAAFGTVAEHRALLTPAAKALAGAVEILAQEVEILDGMQKDPSYGLARFGRLHDEKWRTWKRESFNACAFYPYTCFDLEKLEGSLRDYHLFVIAGWEKNQKEQERHEKARERFAKRQEEFQDKIDQIQHAITLAGN